MAVSNVGSRDENAGTELDSHANMIVAGKQAFIINRTGLTANVHAFADQVQGIPEVPIVDAVVGYDCPFSGKTYLLVMRNALYVPSMEHNLVPPFVMREAGLTVNDTAKIHVEEPTVEDHSIYDEATKLRIPLKLDGVFSYFPTRALTSDEIENGKELEDVFLSPDASVWDPYDETWALNEDALLDDRGDMVYPAPRHHG